MHQLTLRQQLRALIALTITAAAILTFGLVTPNPARAQVANPAAAVAAPAGLPAVAAQEAVRLATGSYAAYGTQREPRTGAYNCNGIDVVINHSWDTAYGQTRHRTSAFWIGTAISPTSRTGDIDNVIQRDQVNGVSVGGWQRDFHASHIKGWAQALSTAYTPFTPGAVHSAFDIGTWSPVGDFEHRCSIQMLWPPY